jgi:hypothetical protein
MMWGGPPRYYKALYRAFAYIPHKCRHYELGGCDRWYWLEYGWKIFDFSTHMCRDCFLRSRMQRIGRV